MAVDASADRRELYALIEHIRTDDIPSVKQFLRAKVDALELLLMNAPVDDEPITQGDLAAIQEAERRQARGERPISSEELLAELGLTGQVDLP